jgi:hypothetical protein
VTAVSRRRVMLAIYLVIVGLLVIVAAAQLIIPGIAAQRVRDRVSPNGIVESVHVSAFPAIKLLFGGHADHITVHMASMRLTQPQTGSLLAQAHRAAQADIYIGTLTEGLLTLRNVVVHKRGANVTATADLENADLQHALPSGLSVSPVSSAGGALVLRAQANVLGIGLGVDATVSASSGALVVQPTGLPFGGLITITLFSDPRVEVEGVGAHARPGGYELTASARLPGG